MLYLHDMGLLCADLLPHPQKTFRLLLTQTDPDAA